MYILNYNPIYSFHFSDSLEYVKKNSFFFISEKTFSLSYTIKIFYQVLTMNCISLKTRSCKTKVLIVIRIKLYNESDLCEIPFGCCSIFLFSLEETNILFSQLVRDPNYDWSALMYYIYFISIFR